jgi:hypothetical protein
MAADRPSVTAGTERAMTEAGRSPGEHRRLGATALLGPEQLELGVPAQRSPVGR